MATRSTGRSRPRRGGGRRRNSLWVWDSVAVTTLAAGAAAFVQLTNDIDDDVLAGMTIVRSLGDVTMRCTGADQDVLPTWGITLVTLDVIAATALPDLGSDETRWLLRAGTWLRRDIDAGLNVEHFPFDVRGKLRLPGREYEVVFIMENSPSSGGSLEFSIAMRTLLLRA